MRSTKIFFIFLVSFIFAIGSLACGQRNKTTDATEISGAAPIESAETGTAERTSETLPTSEELSSDNEEIKETEPDTSEAQETCTELESVSSANEITDEAKSLTEDENETASDNADSTSKDSIEIITEPDSDVLSDSEPEDASLIEDDDDGGEVDIIIPEGMGEGGL